MTHYEITVETENPHFLDRLIRAVETMGLDLEMAEDGALLPHRMDMGVFEVDDETGKTGDMLWGTVYEPDEPDEKTYKVSLWAAERPHLADTLTIEASSRESAIAKAAIDPRVVSGVLYIYDVKEA